MNQSAPKNIINSDANKFYQSRGFKKISSLNEMLFSSKDGNFFISVKVVPPVCVDL